jgi:hypothetical protein
MLDWQTIHLPLAAGVDQKKDDRALTPPSLAVARDLQFEEQGGLQTRKPFGATGASIFGGGTITTARRIVRNGDEWLLFSKDALYSWDAALSKWVLRATHLAVATEERAVFTSTGDQVDGDRAELSGTVLFAWVEADGLWVAAQDKTTGAVLMTPTLANNVGTRPRFVVCSTKILLFWIDTAAGDLECIAIDPAAPATAVAGAATTVIAATNSYYDVVKVPGADTAIGGVRHTTTTSYKLFKVTSALAVTTSTKTRTCDGPIAVSCEPTGTSLQVIRSDTTNIVGDRITISSLADAATAQAIGTVGATVVSQIAAAHRSVQDGGAYRCYVFWTHQEAVGATDWQSKVNYVDTAGTIGTQATFIRRLGLGSRAFDHDGRVYVWGVFAGESSFSGASPSTFRAQLQNTYFLYRDDATLHAKAVFQRAGGLAPSIGRLPQVSLSSGASTYAWCATERRVIELGGNGHSGYSDRGPVEVSFTFDDNRARRTARLGATLYVSGGEILQYDGSGLYEVGYHVYPWYFGAVEVPTGNLADGSYTYKVTWRWENARGERDRSTTATHGDVTIAAGPNGVSITSWIPLFITHKTSRPFAVEVWRTAVNPTPDAPFYLATSQDPAATSNPNRAISNDTTASVLATFNDEFADSTLTTKESNPENGAVLENLAPPAATIIAAYGSRVFLGGVAGDPRRIWYSKQRNDGEVVAFHDALTFELPLEGGDLVAITFMDGVLVALCETAVYMVPGDGFDNLGGGANYGPGRTVSADVGCRDHDSVAVTPQGIVFQSSKGKYLLTRGWSVQPIGTAVVDYDSEAIVAAHVVEAQHQVRWLTGSRMLVLDYLAEQWAEWTLSSGVHACIWNGVHHYLTAAGPLAEQATFTGTSYGLYVETAWIKPADLQGAISLRKMKILGEYRSACNLRLSLLYDYATTVTDTKAWTPTPTTVGGPLEVSILPSRQQCQAVKLRISVEGAATQATLATATDLSDKVSLSPLSDWTATITATPLGDLGNDVSLSLAFVTSTTAAVLINNHREYDIATSRWIANTNNLGVLVTGNDTTATVTIATIEAAINAWSQLLQVSSAHATPTARVNFALMGGIETAGALTAGAFAAATGESIKLTGLALELGYQRGIYKRLPASQRT